MKTAVELRSHIMRRVYYAYALSLALHPTTVRLALLLGSILALAQLVHVAVLYEGITSVAVGELGTYLFAVVTHADWPTLVVFFIAIMVVLSFRLPIMPLRRQLAV